MRALSSLRRGLVACAARIVYDAPTGGGAAPYRRTVDDRRTAHCCHCRVTMPWGAPLPRFHCHAVRVNVRR
eukprot:3429858-Prymnesium_polylepis.3